MLAIGRISFKDALYHELDIRATWEKQETGAEIGEWNIVDYCSGLRAWEK